MQHIDFPGAVGQSKTMFAGAGAAPPPAAPPGGQPFAPPAAPPIPGAGAQVKPGGPPPGPPRPGMPGGPAPAPAPMAAPAPAPAPAPMAAPAPAPAPMGAAPGMPGAPAPAPMGAAPGMPGAPAPGMPGAPPPGAPGMGAAPGQPPGMGAPQPGMQPGAPAPGMPPGQPAYPGQPGHAPAAVDGGGGFMDDLKAGFALLKPVMVPVVLVLGSIFLPLVGLISPLLILAACAMLVRARVGMNVDAAASVKWAMSDFVGNWVSALLAGIVPFAGLAGGVPSMVIEGKRNGDALSRGIEILKLDIGRIVIAAIIAGFVGSIAVGVGGAMAAIPYVGYLFFLLLLVVGYGFMLGLMLATGVHQYFALRAQHEGADVEAEAV
ncbi:MAG: hypothetical protein AAGA54_17150, partial [Myxococcota bacterium]